MMEMLTGDGDATACLILDEITAFVIVNTLLVLLF
jgi:hypothetical protein